MNGPFDEAAFKRSLIDRGTDPDVASDIAAKTAESRNRQLKEQRMVARADAVARTNTDPARGPISAAHIVRDAAGVELPGSGPQAKPPAKATRKTKGTSTTARKPREAEKRVEATPKKISAVQRKAKSPAPLSDKAFSNGQLSLFQSFLANTEEQRDILSNAVDLWDNIPRYSVPRKRQEELRKPGGYLEIKKLSFQYRTIPLTAVIRPARLEVRDANGHPTGETVEYYPSSREELIEQALRRLATESGSGFLDGEQPRSGLHFTLYRLRQELTARGHAMTHRDLAEGLDVLSLSTIDIETGDKDTLDLGKFGRASFIVNLAGVKREDLDRNPHARWYVEFHPLVTASIEKITYRQFNYERWMRARTQLARWLIAQLVLKYTQAALTHSFVMKFSTIKRDSGLLDGYSLDRQAVVKVDEAWEELKQLNVLTSFQKDEERGARSKLMDVRYTLVPTRVFSSEQRAANKRLINAKGDDQPLSPQDKLL